MVTCTIIISVYLRPIILLAKNLRFVFYNLLEAKWRRGQLLRGRYGDGDSSYRDAMGMGTAPRGRYGDGDDFCPRAGL